MVVLVFALVVLGPNRLLEVARGLGRLRAQLRELSSGLPPGTAKLIRDPRGTLFDALAEPRQAMADTAEAARQSITPTTDDEHGGSTDGGP